jgi:hypothetical protein
MPSGTALVSEHAKGRFDLGAAVAAVHVQVQVPRGKASEDIDERFCVDSRLAKHASQCSHSQIAAMEWHHAGDAGFATLRVA